MRTRGGTDGALPDSDLPPTARRGSRQPAGHRWTCRPWAPTGSSRPRHDGPGADHRPARVQLQQTVTNLVTTELVVAAITLAIAGRDRRGAGAPRAASRWNASPPPRAGSARSRWTAARCSSPSACRTPTRRTEVGQVGAALNHMLDHVGAALEARQDSEMQLRQFVADASHELRTPLAAIRGYAELTRRGPLSEDADLRPLPHLLAGRTDDRRWSRTCSCSPASTPAGRSSATDVDLTRLVVDAVSDAHAAGPSHRWQLDLPDEPVTVRGRRVAAAPGGHQPARQRAHPHAARHGRRGHAGGRSRARPGCRSSTRAPASRAELLPHVFERFARGSTSALAAERQHRARPGDRVRGGRGARRRRQRDEQAGAHRVHGAAADGRGKPASLHS